MDLDKKTNTIYQWELRRLQRGADAAFVCLLMAQWVLAILLAVFVSPRTWDGVTSTPHAHVAAAVLLGGALTIYPSLLAWWRRGEFVTRVVFAIAQMGYSALLIHLMAGRIEAHFHVFGSLAFLAFYRDVRVFIPAVVVTGLDHFARGLFWPESVFGVANPAAWRTLEHVAWVLFEVGFLAWGVRQGCRNLRNMAEFQAIALGDRDRYARDAASFSEDLYQERDLLRTIVDTIPHPLFWKDEDLRYKGCNLAFAQAVGLGSVDEVVGLTDQDLSRTPAEAEQAMQSDRQVVTTGEEIRNREEIRRAADGTETCHWASKCPVRNSDGAIVGIVGALIDATDQHHAYSELQELHSDLATRQALLDAVIENVEEGILAVDHEGQPLCANRSALEILGCGPEGFDPGALRAARLLFKADGETLVPDGEFPVPAEGEGRPVKTQEFIVRRHAGDLSVMGTSAAFQTGAVRGAVWTLCDITENKRRADELAQLNRDLAAGKALIEGVFDTAADGIIVTDAIGRIVRSNRSADLMLSGGEPLVGKPVTAFVGEEGFGGLRPSGDEPRSPKEVTVVTSEGREFEAELSVSSISLDNRTLCTGILRDVTERRRLESQLLQASKLESIGQLASGIAHEINTPMQFIGSNVGYMSRQLPELVKQLEKTPSAPCTDGGGLNATTVTDCFSDALEDCQLGVDRVVEIVAAMKDFAHPGAAGHTATDVNKCIHDAAVITKNHTKRFAVVELDLKASAMLVGSASTLNQTFVNLLTNAADAIEEARSKKGPQVGAITVSSRDRPGGIEVRVTDTGCGMPAEVAGRAFDPFFTTKGVGVGSGQGLAIAYRAIVQEHGGEITIDSDPGEGTTVTIFLPTTAEPRTGVSGAESSHADRAGAEQRGELPDPHGATPPPVGPEAPA